MSEQAKAEMYWTKRLTQENRAVRAARFAKEPYAITTALIDAAKTRLGRPSKPRRVER